MKGILYAMIHCLDASVKSLKIKDKNHLYPNL